MAPAVMSSGASCASAEATSRIEQLLNITGRLGDLRSATNPGPPLPSTVLSTMRTAPVRPVFTAETSNAPPPEPFTAQRVKLTSTGALERVRCVR